MDARPAGSITSSAKATAANRRSKPRAYLLLARVSNLPTVWTNVLAAFVCAHAVLDSVLLVTLAVSLLYTAGMFLNDVCDAAFDADARPDRPIPNGDVTRNQALGLAIALMIVAEAVLLTTAHRYVAAMWGAALIVAITIYNVNHKGQWHGPIVMGLCRALVYGVAASSVTGIVATPVLIAAGVMWLYVIALTWVAKAANLGYAVPWMLAGICLVDAAIMLAMGEPRLALIAIIGFPLTLALQRVVPGT